MIIKYKDKTSFVCDQCGKFYEDPTYNLSSIEISFNYGGEDPCWGAHDDKEGKLFDKYGNEDCNLLEYLAQEEVHICDSCRDNGGVGYINDFIQKLRKNRVKQLERLIKKGLLPEFCAEKRLYVKKWEGYLKEAKGLYARIEDGIKEGIPVLSLLVIWNELLKKAEGIAELAGRDMCEFARCDLIVGKGK